MTRAYDPTDPDQVAERQTTAERARQQAEADWRWLVAHPQGRRILAELMAVTGFLHGSFAENPMVSAFNEGKRAVGQQLYARFTNAVDGAGHAALLAEVLTPHHVRNGRTSNHRSARDSGARDDGDAPGG